MVAGRGPSFTIGGGKDDVGKVPSRGGEDVPGPGAYDVVGAPDDGDVRGSRNKGFTFGGKVGVDWASAGPGRDAPAVGKYFRDLDKLGGDVRDSVNGPGGRGPAFSFGTAPARPRDDPTTGPGPGDYHRDGDDDTNANDAKTEKDAKTKSNRSGFTFGYRRESGDGGVGGGPGGVPTERVPGRRRPGRPPRGSRVHARPETSRGWRGGRLGGQGARPRPRRVRRGRGRRRRVETSQGPPSPSRGKSRIPPERRNARARFPVRDSTPSPPPWGRARPRSRCTRAWRIRRFARRRNCPVPERTAPPSPPVRSCRTRRAGGVRARPRGVGEHGVGRRGGGPPRSRGLRHKRHRATDRERAVVHDGREGRKRRKSPSRRGTSAPGPGEYDRDGDVPARPDGPSFTFGHRVSVGGALGHLGEKAAQPGPGQYHDRDARARAAAGPSFTFGVKTEVPSDDRVGPSGYSERPGPGEYHDENREPPLGGDGPGFTMYERFPPAGAEAAAAGADGPGPAFYVGPWTAKDLDRGAGVSLAPGMMTNHDAPGGPMDVVKARATIPGPGFYTPEVFQFPRETETTRRGPNRGNFCGRPRGTRSVGAARSGIRSATRSGRRPPDPASTTPTTPSA